MKTIKHVVIRENNGEWEMAHLYGGCYNLFATFPSKDKAIEYANSKKYQITKLKNK